MYFGPSCVVQFRGQAGVFMLAALACRLLMKITGPRRHPLNNSSFVLMVNWRLCLKIINNCATVICFTILFFVVWIILYILTPP